MDVIFRRKSVMSEKRRRGEEKAQANCWQNEI